ncbi:MAG TPA: hypothetical protein VIF10_15855 [Methylobacter sp.]|jgi:hypothetical protein
MKILNVLVLLASLFAIAGAAIFQLFVLLANALFAQPIHNRHPSSLS